MSRALNLFAVKWYGEAEFWLSLGKVLLSIGLILYTFVVMLGGNPLGDRFGFRYWNEPGAFNEYYKTGDTGRFLGVLAALITASFTIAGPDYVSMAAGETINPRKVLPKAFNGVFYRLTAFFVLGVLCVGILVPYNDKVMADAFDNDQPGAAASPYVISMDRLKIPILPDIVNAVILTASFSAGNSYMYCASRSLYGLALEGKAPKFLTKCTSRGVPVYCVGIVLVIALLSFLQVSNSAAVVLNWLVNLVRLFRAKSYSQKSNQIPGNRLPTDQLLRCHFHLHPIQEGYGRPGNLQRLPPVYQLVPAVYRLRCLYLHHHHGVRRWLHRLLTW
jgi:amino acid transporter